MKWELWFAIVFSHASGPVDIPIIRFKYQFIHHRPDIVQSDIFFLAIKAVYLFPRRRHYDRGFFRSGII